MKPSRISFTLIGVLFVLLLLVAACAPATPSGSEATSPPEATPTEEKPTELHLFVWSDELPEETINDFQEETGIRVTVDTYDSNESMIAKLEAGATGYDIVNPSQYAVQILINKGLLEPLDHSKLSNYNNLSEVFKNVSFDPGNKYSIPYLWGTTGLAYNDTCVKEPVTSWKALWDEKYAGRIYMLDNMLAAYIAGLQINGFDANSTNPEEIAKATESLIEQKKVLAGYNSTNFADLVASGEACLVQAWSGNVIQVIDENPHVHYVIPDEGGTMWVDSYSIVKGAKNVKAAYLFIDYLLRGEVAGKVTNLTKIANTVATSTEFIDPKIANNPAIYPPEEKIANADFILDPGEAMKYFQEGWTKVKAATP